MLERRDVEIAHQDAFMALGHAALAEPCLELIDELELVGEFLVDLGVRLVTARRHIEIVNGDGLLAGNRHRDVAAVVLAAERLGRLREEGSLGNDGDAVIALLAELGDMLVARVPDGA